MQRMEELTSGIAIIDPSRSSQVRLGKRKRTDDDDRVRTSRRKHIAVNVQKALLTVGRNCNLVRIAYRHNPDLES